MRDPADVLTPDLLRRAIASVRDEPPRPSLYIGPPWAQEHLAQHDGGLPGCERCAEAWAVLVRA